MKAAPFAYHRPATLDTALDLLAEHGDEAKVLAGGQSLVPLMALRLARPAHLIDLGRISDLDAIAVADDRSVHVGALVRHADAERSDDIARHAPLVHRAMPHVAHRAIRTRGTVVGSIAHGDPAAELPAVALATGATITAASRRGTRTVDAADFFEGYLQTALAPDEIATGVTFPPWLDDAVCSVVEVARRHGDYALVGVATQIRLDGDTVAAAALAYFGTTSTPVRVPAVEQALVGRPLDADSIDAAAAAATEALEPPADIHGTTAYRKHLAGVVTRRGLADAT